METFILSHGSYLSLPVLTATGLPVPEEVVVAAAGVLSAPSVARLDPRLALAVCLAGVLIGDCALYWIGRTFGHTYLRQHRWFCRLVPGDRAERMEGMVQHHSLRVFLLARFLVGLRTPLYVAMGIMRIDFRRFVLSDGACGVLAVCAFFLPSYFGAAWIGVLIHRSEWAVTAIVPIVAAGASAYYFIWKKSRQQLRLNLPGSGDTHHEQEAS
ncbi:DedA family protein [Mycobacterium shinjukuense]|uniref:Uncharacterized protein n=1 Tax=Mycobacterium shinjukuense TaxID=398694 RepID=A0A7I7MM94_9MYCO|nr:DedA family protein [Mycobacterium shinjukuense]MCV6984056.1 DedA family protein [Mycobacterium shinjukuense]ORB66527.1 hypothetical protein BST45_13735 [Mycobacterium shinjukuense]BBX72429.1 hypothetical protein MSHI_03350 [Mycobacterium shinjukuense]